MCILCRCLREFRHYILPEHLLCVEFNRFPALICGRDPNRAILCDIPSLDLHLTVFGLGFLDKALHSSPKLHDLTAGDRIDQPLLPLRLLKDTDVLPAVHSFRQRKPEIILSVDPVRIRQMPLSDLDSFFYRYLRHQPLIIQQE